MVIRQLACNWNICSLQKGKGKNPTPESLDSDKVLEKADLEGKSGAIIPGKEKKDSQTAQTPGSGRS